MAVSSRYHRTLRHAVLVCGSAWLIAASLFSLLPAPERALASNWLLPLFKLASVAACAWAACQARSQRRLQLAWSFFALGSLFSTIGQTLWSAREMNPRAESLSLPMDVFFLGAYALALVGILLLPSSLTNWLERIKLHSETGILLFSAMLVFWMFWWAPILETMALPNQDLALAMAYPIGDLVLCWSALFVLFSTLTQQPRGPIVLLNLAFFLQASSNLIYGTLLRGNSYQSGHWLDLGWLGVPILVALASIYHVTIPPTPAAKLPEWLLGSVVLRIILPYSAVALSFVLLIYAHQRQHSSFPSVAVIVVLIVALSLLRQVIALWENARLSQDLQSELRERQQAQAQLQNLNLELEQRVQERTRELSLVNEHLRQSEARLSHEALHDALTQLPNRTLFMDRLGRSLERARRFQGYGFAVLFLDFDGFKVVNDSLGHTLGDRLLVGIAKRLADGLRSADTVARLGGDEFVILLEDVHESQDAASAAERVLAQLAKPFELDEQRVFISASIGVVLSGLGYVGADDVLRDADIAMYQAKTSGKARYAVFDEHMRTRAVQRLSLESELRNAIERREFYLNYQPILDLQHRRLSGFEALLRWRHPERGHVPPGDFIPVAEETGLIVPIGEWVLHEACRQVANWQSHFQCDPPFSISVNLSARQFKQTNLAQQVAEALAAADLSAQSLKLEITESAIIEEPQAAIATLTELRQLGVQVQIDDFGTGYSSLSYLHRFPVDTLKIDRSFIGRMGVDGNNAEIVRTIITLAHDLGMSVIAEGLETPEQMERVTRLTCEQGQGYLISRPLDVEQAARFIRDLGTDLRLPLVLAHSGQSA